MSEQKKIPTLSEEDAFYWSERNVLNQLTDEQRAQIEKKFAISARALADHQAKQGVKSQTDFDRKVMTATNAEFDKIKADLIWEAQRKGQS